METPHTSHWGSTDSPNTRLYRFSTAISSRSDLCAGDRRRSRCPQTESRTHLAWPLCASRYVPTATLHWKPAGQPNTRRCRPPITISSRGDLQAETGGGSRGAQTLHQAGLAPPLAPLVVSPPHRSRWELADPPELRPCRPLTTISFGCGTNAEAPPTSRTQIKLFACHRLLSPVPSTPANDTALTMPLSHPPG